MIQGGARLVRAGRIVRPRRRRRRRGARGQGEAGRARRLAESRPDQEVDRAENLTRGQGGAIVALGIVDPAGRFVEAGIDVERFRESFVPNRLVASLGGQARQIARPRFSDDRAASQAAASSWTLALPNSQRRAGRDDRSRARRQLAAESVSIAWSNRSAAPYGSPRSIRNSAIPATDRQGVTELAVAGSVRDQVEEHRFRRSEIEQGVAAPTEPEGRFRRVQLRREMIEGRDRFPRAASRGPLMEIKRRLQHSDARRSQARLVQPRIVAHAHQRFVDRAASMFEIVPIALQQSAVFRRLAKQGVALAPESRVVEQHIRRKQPQDRRRE